MMPLSLSHTTITSQFTKIINSVIFFKQPRLQIISEPIRTPWLLISMLRVLKGMQLVRIFR